MSTDALAAGWGKTLGGDRKQFDMFFDKMLDGFSYHKIVLDKAGRPIDYVFLEVNSAFEKMTGLKRENIIGKRATDVLPGIEKDPANWMGIYGHVALTGESTQFESFAVSLSKWYKVIAYCPAKDHFVALFEDITERKKAEEALKQSEQRYSGLFNSIPEGFCLVEIVHDKNDAAVDLRFLEVNDAYAKLVNRSREQIIGKTTRESFGAVEDYWYQLYDKVAKTGEFVHYENYVQLHDRYYEVYAWRADAANHVAILNSNVTERKKAEEALRNLYRHQRAVSDSNQALMHASDENLLTQEVCDIMIKDCGYALVWVGFAEHDQNKTVRPVAFAGFDKDYIDSLRITWDENSERGRGPTGTVIRTGKPYVCRNTQIDPNFEPWRSAALKRGYTASLVLPLTAFDGKTFGALNIYSQQTDPFTDEEVKLLTELANDFAYGIMMLRIRKEREQAEKALRESESMLQNIIDGSSSFIFLKDKDGRFITINKWLEESLGMKREEIRGKTDYDIFPKEVADYYRKNDLQVLETKQPIQTEEIFDSPDGKKYTLLANKFPLFNSSGEVTATCSISTDITERKKVEEALRESRAKLQVAFASLTEAIFIVDAEGNIVDFNDEFVRYHRFKDKDECSRNIADCPRYIDVWLLDGTPAPVEKWAAARALRGEIGSNVEYRLRRKETGETWWGSYNFSPIKDLYGKIVGAVVAARDITEYKKAEEAIARQAELIDLSPDAIIVRKLDGTITFWSKGAEKLYGLTKEEAIGQDINSLLKTEFPQPLEKSLNTLKLDGKWSGELVHTCKNGDKLVLQSFWLAKFDEDGKIFEMLESNVDITKRIELQAKLEESAARVEEFANQMEELAEKRAAQLKDTERLAAIGATAGMVGHDIRNPLQAITGDLYLARTELAEGPDYEGKNRALESISEIEKNVDYINKIVADLQDYARPLNPRAQEANIKLLFNEIKVKNGVPKNIKLTVDVEEKAEKIMADPDYLKRIISNLTLNAIQAMPNGGELIIHAFVDKKTSDVLITVKDTGVGIPEDVKPKLFTPMMTTKSKGQGFGLAVVKRMTEGLGGTVTFESTEGKGTTFIVRLPPQKN